MRSPLVLNGAFPAGTRIDLTVGTVSVRGKIVVRADDQIIFEKEFVSGPESKEGEKIVYLPQYKSYQNVFDEPQSATLAKAAKVITISNDDGDWMTLTALSITTDPSGASYPISLDTEWGKPQAQLTFDPTGKGTGSAWAGSGQAIDRAWLWHHQIAPFKALEAQGVGVMVGEWGCFEKTPYEVTLRWMEDNLANFKLAGWGWALWDFSGSFGVLDSHRPGAVYEDFHGHKLDRRMLELLQRY
jgi:hypothetical protein